VEGKLLEPLTDCAATTRVTPDISHHRRALTDRPLQRLRGVTPFDKGSLRKN
jgi:hypothetical protein